MAEIGTTNDLAEIVQGLRARGLDYPYSEWIQGANLERHVSLLSRFPIVERHSRTNYTYLLDNKLMGIERGILDVLVKVNDHYSFRAIMVHLKSKRSTSLGDQARMRRNEADLLRHHLGNALKADPRLNLIAMGDFNDTPGSDPVRAILVGGPLPLFDLTPLDSRGESFTHLWRARGEKSRLDYLAVSPGMSNEYVAASARIAESAGTETASDHRAIYARFLDRDVAKTVVPTAAPAPLAAVPAAPGPPASDSFWVNVLIGVVVLETIAVVALVLALRQANRRSF
jgi:endonuclease/exonuclease/phosphatase family metal-dependent hydrolase